MLEKIKTKIAVEMLVIFLIIFIPFREVISLYTTDFVKLIPDFLIILVFFIKLLKKEIKFNKIDVVFFVFMVFSFLSTYVVNGNGILPYVIQIRSISVMYFFYIISRKNQFSQKFLNIFSIITQIEVIFLSLFGYIEKIFNKGLYFPETWAKGIIYEINFQRVYSFLNNPNIFGAFIVFSILILTYFEEKNKIKKITPHFYIFSLAALFLTASRSSLITLILSIIAIFTIMNNKKNILPLLKYISFAIVLTYIINILSSYNSLVLIMLFLVAILVVTIEELLGNQRFKAFLITIFISIAGVFWGVQYILVSPPTFINEVVDEPTSEIVKDAANIETSTETKETFQEQIIKDSVLVTKTKNLFSPTEIEQSSTDGRIYRVINGLKLFSKAPVFGYGFGTYGSSSSLIISKLELSNEETNMCSYADNQYIALLVETGIVGFILIAALYILLLIKYKNEKFKIFVLLIIAFLGLFYNILEIKILMFLLFLFINFNLSKIENLEE